MTRAVLDRRRLGLALTRLANQQASAAACVQTGTQAGAEAGAELVPSGPPARRIGVTGPPGAGKSTLVGRLALQRSPGGVRVGVRVGVLAIDPSSPRTGGAILGDRIRMDELAGAEELYIRSIGSRTASDGLSDNLPAMLDLMDAFGFDEVLLETVGVGQVEHAVRQQVDTLVLVILPDSGDFVQAMKAGIMEVADIFVISKADLAGAPRMAAEIQRMAALAAHGPGGWVPPVLLTSHTQPASIAELSRQIDRHQAWLAGAAGSEGAGALAAVRLARARYRLRRLLERRAAQVIGRQGSAFFDQPLADQLAQALRALADLPT